MEDSSKFVTMPLVTRENGQMVTELPRFERGSTGVMEGMAVVWLSIYGNLCYGRSLLLETDSASVVFALDCCYSKRPAMMAVIVGVMSLCCKYHIVLRMRHVFRPRVKFHCWWLVA